MSYSIVKATFRDKEIEFALKLRCHTHVKTWVEYERLRYISHKRINPRDYFVYMGVKVVQGDKTDWNYLIFDILH